MSDNKSQVEDPGVTAAPRSESPQLKGSIQDCTHDPVFGQINKDGPNYRAVRTPWFPSSLELPETVTDFQG